MSHRGTNTGDDEDKVVDVPDLNFLGFNIYRMQMVLAVMFIYGHITVIYLKEKATPENECSLSTLRKPCTKFSHSLKFQPMKCRFSM